MQEQKLIVERNLSQFLLLTKVSYPKFPPIAHREDPLATSPQESRTKFREGPMVQALAAGSYLKSCL